MFDVLTHMYPAKFKLDVVKGLKNIYSNPLLPELELTNIQKFVRNISITEYEANRNVVRKEPFCKTTKEKKDVYINAHNSKCKNVQK